MNGSKSISIMKGDIIIIDLFRGGDIGGAGGQGGLGPPHFQR